MNIKVRFISVISAALLLTGCARNTETESGSSSVPDSVKSSDTSSVSPSTATDTSSAIGTSTATSTSSSTNTLSSSSTSSNSAATYPEEFKISDYMSGFDDVEPVGVEYVDPDSISCDETIIEQALEVYKNSECFSEAIESAYDRFQVENGQLIPRDAELIKDEKMLSSYMDMWGNMLSVNDSNEIEIGTSAVYGFTAKLDGIHDESIVVLESYLPAGFMEYSGTTVFYPVVYINADGEATVIELLSRQTLQNITRIEFADGTIQLLVESGHTTGTQRSIVYSFNDGKPIEELCFSNIWREGSVFFGGFDSNTPSKAFFRYGNEYCMLEAVQPSKAISDMLCADNNILETIPDAAKEIADGNVYVIGGKYVSFKTQRKTFEFVNGSFQMRSSYISNAKEYILTRSNDYWDFEGIEVSAYNINLDK